MNVRGLFSSVKKRNDVFDWAKGKNTSIVCFQETHSSKEVDDGYSRNISCALN
jgi:exonuclease III